MRLFFMDPFYDMYVQEVDKNDTLANKLKYLKAENKSMLQRIHYLEDTADTSVQKAVDSAVSKVSSLYEEKMNILSHKIAHLESLLNINSDNSGIPTSLTPPGKDKRVPNTREKTGKPLGGQKGRKKSTLEKFEDDEVTDNVEHEVKTCEFCGGEFIDLGTYVSKDELDFKVIVKRIRHNFHEFICKDCGQKVKAKVPKELKEENQYGKNVQALAITLINQGYVSMGRTSEIIYGLSMQEIKLSTGFISKLQKRLSSKLEKFMKELKIKIIGMKLLHWDDTVISISNKQACLRVYGDAKMALYTAHEKKDKAGLDKDGVLNLLSEDTVVVHDHNIVNYNEDYTFQNAECCVHLTRDLRKVIDNLNHEWAKNMLELITGTHKKRNTFLGLDTEQVLLDYDKEILLGRIENSKDKNAYFADSENALLNRLVKYKDNYLMWVVNSEIPFSNNEAERSLRSSKTKMKVSGQFQNIKSAEYFANIKSYIETGKRHDMNIEYLIIRALSDDYCTLEEMKSHVL